MAGRLLKAEDLYRLKLISGCRLSPDGGRIIFTVDRIDPKTQKRYANLHLAWTEGRARTRRFTSGDQVDRNPRWSPDGARIAFISDRGSDSGSEIFLIPTDGGEALPLTRLGARILDFCWSPDGRSLAAVVQKKDPDEIEREKDEQKKKLGIVSRRITRLFYKEEAKGYLPQERTHLWLVRVPSGKAVQLTDSEVFDEWSPSFSPDGKTLVFCSNRSPDPDQDPEAIDLFLLPLGGGRMRRIKTPAGPKELPVFSPDGKRLAYLGVEDKGAWWKNVGLWVVPLKGGRAADLLADHDLSASNWTLNDIAGIPGLSPPTWSKDGSRIFFQVSAQGSLSLFSISPEEPEKGPVPVMDRAGALGDFSLDQEQTRTAFFWSDLRNPGEVAVKNLVSGRTRTLTGFNRRILSRVRLGRVEEIWFKGPDKNDLQGWIVFPPDFNPSGSYPSILEIHGGPMVQYGHVFIHEVQFLAAQGYLVFLCNPRGSSGYGQAHTKAIWNDWGNKDFQDLMAMADLVQTRPYVDQKRMGVTGGSYGGFMTNWIIGQTDRFRAAVTQRCLTNLISFYGTSDFNWTFQFEFGNRPPWEDLENYWRQSPLKNIGQAKTPTLIIHSEQDMRCPIEQGEQLFVALKKLGVETEMVVFPEESHELSRAGRTDRRIDRLNHILRWFDKHLKA